MLSITARQKGEWFSDIPAEQLCEWLEKPDTLLWIDIVRPREEDLALLTDQFEFHPLAVEDVHNSHQRPKIDLYEGCALLVFYAVSYDPDEHLIYSHEIEMFVGGNYVITIHDDPIVELDETHHRWERNIPSISEHLGALLYSILDSVLDGYFPVLDWVSEHLDELEDRIFDDYNPQILKEALRMKRSLLGLRRLVGPQRDVINVLLRGEGAILPPEALPFLQDLYDHSLRIVENVDTYREMVTAVTDGFLTVQSNNTNEVMRRLTVINLLFLPLAVLTGFFGMNFDYIPFGNPWLLVGALTAMIALPVGLYFFLARRGWG